MTNSFGYIFMLALVLLALLPAIFACTPSADALGGCQINGMEGSSQGKVEPAVLYRHINYYDESPIHVTELGDITSLDGDVSSLKIPPGYELVLFEGENLTAPFVVLTG